MASKAVVFKLRFQTNSCRSGLHHSARDHCEHNFMVWMSSTITLLMLLMHVEHCFMLVPCCLLLRH